MRKAAIYFQGEDKKIFALFYLFVKNLESQAKKFLL